MQNNIGLQALFDLTLCTTYRKYDILYINMLQPLTALPNGHGTPCGVGWFGFSQ